MNIFENIKLINTLIADYATKYQRDPKAIHLLAVSKTQPSCAIKEAFHAGQTNFAENYLQEALIKIHELQSLRLNWHFIGPIQSNKTRAIAENFNWVHSVDRIKIAERLSEQRPKELPALNIFLQVNLDNEASKSGFTANEIVYAARHIALLPNLNLCGLMCIPAPRQFLVEQRAIFAKLVSLQTELNAHKLMLNQLSMGMSADIEAAIAEGSNWLRIGQAIFGKRHS